MKVVKPLMAVTAIYCGSKVCQTVVNNEEAKQELNPAIYSLLKLGSIPAECGDALYKYGIKPLVDKYSRPEE